MDQVEPLGVIIGAALGSAGLSGALAGLVQFSRAARTARLIEHIKKSLEGDEKGAGEQTLRLALDRERLRLASLSIIGTPQVFVQFLGLLVVTAAITVGVLSTGLVSLALPWGTDRDGDGVAGEVGSASTAAWLVAVVFVAYIVFFAFAMDSFITRSRARFMAEASAPKADLPRLTHEAGNRGVRFWMSPNQPEARRAGRSQ
ncbi:hypothetical protein ACFXQA_05605 [Microbacterium sp. P07]|uniref:hypothetical protein n=1 Tax=Microbacterium sp. P07 TaxID=3366952 RepID=UPI003746C9AA